MRIFRKDYGRFELESFGRGFAYALTEKATLLSVYMQGDDATQFEDDRLSIEQTFPDMSDDNVLAYLWDQFAYGVAANYSNAGVVS